MNMCPILDLSMVTQYGIRGSCGIILDRARFKKKKLQKWGKWAKNRVFGIYWKI